jgi:hypothetical protein
MHEYGSLPRARQDGLLEEGVGEELLLYDQDRHTAHCLSRIAACVWRHCDGEHDVTELARLAGASENLVADALHELRGKNMLAAEAELTHGIGERVSRREVIVRGARYGAVAAAGSMIVSATAATPAMASSGEEIAHEGEDDYECHQEASAPKNCCMCVKACIETPEDAEECSAKCITKWGGYESWTAKAICKKT